MAPRIEGYGDIIAGFGRVPPETVQLIQEGHRADMEAQRLEAQARREADLDLYRKSQLGLWALRLKQEAEKMARPEEVTVGTTRYRRDPTTGQYSPVIISPARERTMTPHYDPMRGVVVEPGPEGGYRAVAPTDLPGREVSDVKPPPGYYWNVPGDPTQGVSRIPGAEGAEKSQTLEQLTSRALQGDVEAQRILDAMEKRQIRIAGATSGAREAAREGAAFSTWTTAEREAAYQDKYYTGQNPSFAWGDRRSRNEFTQGYYRWMTQTGRTPLGSISERSDIRSLQATLNDITKREGLINTFVDRIEANAKVVQELQRRYGRNQHGRLINQAQNMIRRGLTGSGDLESLRLALFSISREVTKVETGQLGIAAPSVTEAAEISKIHDINLNAADLEKVIQTSLWLGRTSQEAMRTTRDRIRAQISAVGTPQAAPVAPPAGPLVSPGARKPDFRYNPATKKLEAVP